MQARWLRGSWTALGVIAAVATTVSGASVKLEKGAIHAPKQEIEVAKTGLPAQWRIEAAKTEMPLEWRGNDADPSEDDLVGIGRGPQLAAPVRLEAVVGGSASVAEARSAAKTKAADGVAVSRAKLAAGAVPISLEARYDGAGRAEIAVTYGGDGTAVERLSVVVSPRGPVDTAFVGPALADEPRSYHPAEFSISPGNGPVWANTGDNVPKNGRDRPGVPGHAFVGSGDRGFSWHRESEDGFIADAKQPTTTLVRDEGGELHWRIHLVNEKTKLGEKRTARFTLRLQPASTRPTGVRKRAWLGADVDWPRADQASADADRVTLAGPAGGDTAEKDRLVTDTYPLRLHRYLAGAHAGRAARLAADARSVSNAGGDPRPDRAALGRGLLLDMGVPASGLANLREMRAVVSELQAFGAFAGDGKTEVLPPWRAAGVVRYGPEVGEPGTNPFSLESESDKALRLTHVTVWRRPKPGKGTRALIAVVNESDTNLRKKLYIEQPKRVFGANENALSPADIRERWEMDAIPDDSDWMSHHYTGVKPKNEPATVLRDVVTDGRVQRPARKEDLTSYGPLFVPANGFRLLYGEGGS